MEVAVFWGKIRRIDIPLREDVVQVVSKDSLSLIVVSSPYMLPPSIACFLQSFIKKHEDQLYELTVTELFRLRSVRVEALEISFPDTRDTIAFYGGVDKERLRTYLYFPNKILRARLLLPDGSDVIYLAKGHFPFTFTGGQKALDLFLKDACGGVDVCLKYP